MLGAAVFREMQARDAVREAEACLVWGHVQSIGYEKALRRKGDFEIAILSADRGFVVRHGRCPSEGETTMIFTGSCEDPVVPDGFIARSSCTCCFWKHYRWNTPKRSGG